MMLAIIVSSCMGSSITTPRRVIKVKLNGLLRYVNSELYPVLVPFATVTVDLMVLPSQSAGIELNLLKFAAAPAHFFQPFPMSLVRKIKNEICDTNASV
jgi:hypothetical protein